MTEFSIQLLVFYNMIALAIASLFYGLGGMAGGRIMRRFISPTIIFLAVVLTAWSLQKYSSLILISLPLLILRNHLGYSKDHGIAWLKRFSIAALSVLTGCVLAYAFSGGWWLVLIHGVVAGSTVFFAFKNPVVARFEESVICILLNLFILGYPFVV